MGRGYWTTIVMVLALGTIRSEAQTWPARQIELIMPWPAGSGVDVIARAIAQAIAAELRQNIVVLNRDGASGTIGFNAFASAPADGYTLGGGPTTPIAMRLTW
jgi:tripartite-type tricarboxylate transporter receptor subunit TctC